jgi:hypothetical protein
VQESLHARIGEAQRRRALVIHGDRSLHILEGGFADEAVVMRWTSSSRRLAAKPILRSSGRFSCSEGTTPSVMTRVRNRPGVRRLTLRSNNQAHLAGAADIEVLADHLLKEDAPRHRLVDYHGKPAVQG